MMIATLLLSCALVVSGCSEPSAVAPFDAPRSAVAFDQTHALWSAVLAAHVQGDRFDYAGLKKDPAKLDAYLDALRAVTPPELAAWSEDERYAFWINAYNAFTIKKVVSNYPLKSIRDLDKAFGLKSVFDDEFIAMPGHHPEGKDDKLSLNDIENGILRPVFKDARVHAAINCASYSCPSLFARAFTAGELDEQLDARMKAFVADPKRNRWNADKQRFEHSEIFDWFLGDFERDAGSARAYLMRYAAPELAAKLKDAKLSSIDYDWSLNGVEPAK
jgi:hypothetical protein